METGKHFNCEDSENSPTELEAVARPRDESIWNESGTPKLVCPFALVNIHRVRSGQPACGLNQPMYQMTDCGWNHRGQVGG
jgi:hypothetical protein